MYLLYGGGFTRAHLIEMVFAEVAVPFELEVVDTVKGEHRSARFLDINPSGFVPALKTPEGVVLYETPAIALYLADRYGKGGLAPVSDDPDRGLFLSSLFSLTGELEPALKRYFYPHRYGVRESDDGPVRDLAMKTISHTLAVIDQRLTQRGPFHLGERYSLPDLILSYWMHSIMDRDAVSGFGAINRCVEAVQNRPVLRGLFTDLENRTRAYADMDRRGDRIP